MRVFSPVLIFFAGSVQALAQSEPAVQPKDFFNDPSRLCAALEEDGIHTGPWKQIGLGFFETQMPAPASGPFLCEFPKWTHAPVGGPPPTRPDLPPPKPVTPDWKLLYRVSGDSGKRADLITVAVTVYQPDTMRNAEVEFESYVAKLFHFIDRPQPSGLVQAIDRHRFYRSRQPYGLVTFSFGTPDRRPNEHVLWFKILD